jgi:hypothetical protein
MCGSQSYREMTVTRIQLSFPPSSSVRDDPIAAQTTAESASVCVRGRGGVKVKAVTQQRERERGRGRERGRIAPCSLGS